MIVVNFFSGPGAGKSTLAAGVFSQLKMKGVNAELVTEFAKDMTWEKNQKALSNQVYMLGNQLQRIYRCQDQVDVIVTDSPLLLNIIYNHDPLLGASFSSLVVDLFQSYNNINYFIKRIKEYNPAGRNETKEEAVEIDSKLLQLLDDNKIPFRILEGRIDCCGQVVQDVLEELNYGKERL